jgi:hypothetical protein
LGITPPESAIALAFLLQVLVVILNAVKDPEALHSPYSWNPSAHASFVLAFVCCQFRNSTNPVILSEAVRVLCELRSRRTWVVFAVACS